MPLQTLLAIKITWGDKQLLVALEEPPINHIGYRQFTRILAPVVQLTNRDRPELSDIQWLIVQALTHTSPHLWHWISNILYVRNGRPAAFEVTYVNSDFQCHEITDTASATALLSQADLLLKTPESVERYLIDKTFFEQFGDLLECVRYRRRMQSAAGSK